MKKTFCEKMGLLKQQKKLLNGKKKCSFFIMRSNNVNKRVLVERREWNILSNH